MVGKTCHKSTETFSNWNIKDDTCEKDSSYVSLRECSTPLLSLPQMYLRARDIRVVVAQAKKEISCYFSVFAIPSGDEWAHFPEQRVVIEPT